MSDEMIDRARRIVAGTGSAGDSRHQLAVALLAEHDAREEAERERDAAVAMLDLVGDDELGYGAWDKYKSLTKRQLWQLLRECRRARRRQGEQVTEQGRIIADLKHRLLALAGGSDES